MIKVIVVLLFFFSLSALSQSNLDDFFSKTDSFLHQNIFNGRVDYQSVVSEQKEMDELILFITETKIDSVPSDSKKAYLINVYNLLVIHQIVQSYPVQSPNDIPGFFKVNKFTVGGEERTLDYIERELLLDAFNDPRLHFVLVCGALGCPPIENVAYNPLELEVQLEAQTIKALNNDSFIYEAEEMVFMSQIFEWNKSDFAKNNDALLTYINSFRTQRIKATKIKFIPYDWSINGVIDSVNDEEPIEKTNLQTYTAGTLLRKGQWDITSFNTIYTQTKSNWKGVDYSGTRETFFTSQLQITYGVSENKRFNVGLDVNFKSSARSVDSTAKSTFNAFDFKNNDSTRVGVATIGPRIKFSPFKRLSNLTIQTTLLFPLVKDSEGNNDLYWLDWDRYTMWNQFFYSKTWSKFQLFTEADLLFRFKRYDGQATHLDVPLTLIGSYFPTSRMTFYGIVQHTQRFTTDGTENPEVDWVIPMNYTSLGLGFKYQPTSQITLELLYTNFVRGENTGLGNTFNIGIKYLTH